MDLARKQEKLRDMRMTVIPIVIGSFETVSKDFEKRLQELDTTEKNRHYPDHNIVKVG